MRYVNSDAKSYLVMPSNVFSAYEGLRDGPLGNVFGNVVFGEIGNVW